MDRIVEQAQVCHLGLCDGEGPYVVPVCFGYDGRALYFHSAPRGRKIRAIAADGAVCFEVETDVELVPAERACKWSIRYRSVMGTGRAALVEDAEGKRRALNAIMRKYSGQDWDFGGFDLNRVAVVRIEIESMTGKTAGY